MSYVQELGSLPQEDQQGIAHVWALFSAAPAKYRTLILRGILAQCCFQQLSFLSAAVRDLIKIDFVSALPTELGYKIFCYLDTTSLCKAAQVSQRWRSLADDDVVWHRMCEQHIDRKCRECGWGLPLLERKRLRTEKRQIQLRAQEKEPNHLLDINSASLDGGSGSAAKKNLSNKIFTNGKRAAEDDNYALSLKRACAEPSRLGTQSPRPSRPWKDVYKARFKVGTNWKHGRCTLKILKGHTNGVMCMQLDDHAHTLATGSYDATVKIWDLRSGECVRTLRGHTSGVRCLQFDDNRLISGSIDRTLKVWNWRSPAGVRESDNADTDNNADNGNNTTSSSDFCLRTLTGHAGGVIGLHFDGNVLASGSTDRTVRVWDTGSRNTFLLRGHTDWVNAVRVDARSRTCFSASDDCTVRLWNLDTRACLRIFEGHVGQVQQLVLMPPEFEPGDDGDKYREGHDDIHAPTARRQDGEDLGHTILSNKYNGGNGNMDGVGDSENVSNDAAATSASLSNSSSRITQSTSSTLATLSPASFPNASLPTTAPPSRSTFSSDFIRSTANHTPSLASSLSQSALLSIPTPSPGPSSSSAYAPPTSSTSSSMTTATTTISSFTLPPPPTYFLTSSLRLNSTSLVHQDCFHFAQQLVATIVPPLPIPLSILFYCYYYRQSTPSVATTNTNVNSSPYLLRPRRRRLGPCRRHPPRRLWRRRPHRQDLGTPEPAAVSAHSPATKLP